MISLLSVTGLGTDNGGLMGQQSYNLEFQNMGYTLNGATNGTLYDENGFAVCFFNLTAVAGQEQGQVVEYQRAPQFLSLAQWYNSSGYYFLFDDPVTQDSTTAVTYDSLFTVNPNDSGNSYTYMLNSSLGTIALIAVIMGVGALAGITFFGTGLSEVSVSLLLMGSFYLAIWAVLSMLAYPLILQAGFYLFIPYFALCFMYTIGVIQSVNGGNDD